MTSAGTHLRDLKHRSAEVLAYSFQAIVGPVDRSWRTGRALPALALT